MRILIVDDNHVDSDVLKKLLKRRFDAEVFQAYTQHEAQSIIRANNLSFIIQDLQMKDSTIEQTLNDVIPNCPYSMYIYTGFDDPTYRQRALDCPNVRDFITKATGKANIIERIAQGEYPRTHDKRLLVAATAARKEEPRERIRTEWKGTIPRLAASIATMIAFASGGILGAWNTARTAGVNSEETRQHFLKLDNITEKLEEAGKRRDMILDELRDKATVSIDDRRAIRDAMKQNNDVVIDWLKRIEVKLDHPRN